MAHLVTHGADAKVVISTAVRDLIDSHATLPGQLLLKNTAKTATYATIDFADPCNSVAINATTGVLTFDCTPAISDNSTSVGTATKGVIVDGDGDVVLTCEVGIGTGFDINLSNNVFGAGDTVQITSLTYTPPA